MLLHANSQDSDQTVDAQVDLSLCLAHRSFCWFCHAAAHFILIQYRFKDNLMCLLRV